jgi:hypothetical protein
VRPCVCVCCRLAADYTSLGSFGNLDYVATTVLPTCGADRHFCSLANEGIQGELLESASVRGCYVYDYRIEQDRQPTRHLRTLVRDALFKASLETRPALGDLSFKIHVPSSLSPMSAS